MPNETPGYFGVPESKWGDQPPGTWIQMPKAVIFDSRLEPLHVAIFAVLAAHADAEGICWPAQKVIAESIGRSTRWVRSGLELLIKLGYVEEIGRKRFKDNRPHACVYRLHPAPFDSDHDKKPTSGADRKPTSGIDRTPVSTPGELPRSEQPGKKAIGRKFSTDKPEAGFQDSGSRLPKQNKTQELDTRTRHTRSQARAGSPQKHDEEKKQHAQQIPSPDDIIPAHLPYAAPPDKPKPAVKPKRKPVPSVQMWGYYVRRELPRRNIKPAELALRFRWRLDDVERWIEKNGYAPDVKIRRAMAEWIESRSVVARRA